MSHEGAPAGVGMIMVLAFAADSTGWPIARYLALDVPSTKDALYGVTIVAVFVVALEILTSCVWRASPPSKAIPYRAARAAGLLPLMWLAFVLAAPLGKEITFWGFLFRSWATSRLSAQGTILLSAAAFATCMRNMTISESCRPSASAPCSDG